MPDGSTIRIMPSPSSHPNDPLHGVTLEKIVRRLQDRYGWKEMGERIAAGDRTMKRLKKVIVARMIT